MWLCAVTLSLEEHALCVCVQLHDLWMNMHSEFDPGSLFRIFAVLAWYILNDKNSLVFPNSGKSMDRILASAELLISSYDTVYVQVV